MKTIEEIKNKIGYEFPSGAAEQIGRWSPRAVPVNERFYEEPVIDLSKIKKIKD